MAKKGLLKYAEDGGIADDSDKGKDKDEKPAKDGGHSSAGEMLKMELLERFLSPPYGGDKTDIERKRGQLEAFGRLLECYRSKEG